MGGWLVLLLIRELGRRTPADARVARLVLIAPAVDFTEELMWKRFPSEVRREIERTGVWARPSQYSDEPYLFSRALIEVGRKHLLLDSMIGTRSQTRYLHGFKHPHTHTHHSHHLTPSYALHYT